jgi:hypothetical protein
MTVGAHAHGFLTYLWHYVLARLIYDDLVRPLTRGGAASIFVGLGCVAGAFVLIRWRRSRGRR